MQAILVLAHKDPEQVYALSKYLSKRFEVYIHFDKKFNLSSEWLEKYQSLNRVSCFCEYPVYWGGFSIMEAMLFLFKKALLNQENTYFHVISGQDWPLLSVDDLYEYYENRTDIFMTYWSTDGVVKSHEPIELWYKYYYYYDDMNRKSLYGKVYHRFSILWQTFLRKNKFKDLHIQYGIYQGANWCDMPRDVIEYCLDVFEKDQSLQKLFRTSFCPDEALFQTILVNSDFKNRIINDNHRFMIWQKKHESYPAILDIEDWKNIDCTGKYHFMRKVDFTYSKALIQKLEEKIGKFS